MTTQLASKLPQFLRDGAPLCVAYGAGVDSTAVLVGLHQRGLRPDVITFADTGGEWPETYAYLPVINAWLRSVGFPEVTVVRKDCSGHGRYDTLEGNCLANQTLPGLAFGGKSCSLKWKAEVQHAYRKTLPLIQAAWARGGRARVAIGYDAGPKDAKRSAIAEDTRYTYWYPLRDWGWDRDECIRQIAAAGLPVPRKSACFFCLAGDTEVVTRDGIRRIRDLAGGRHRLLVPSMGTLGGLGHRGSFQEVEVHSFGEQELFDLRLRRGSATMTVRATAEHRWFVVSGEQWSERASHERTTSTLRVGDRLRTLRATAPAREGFMPVAAAQGFVYGDGTRPSGREGPASVMIYNISKDSAMLECFPAQQMRTYVQDGKPSLHIYGLPRFWKDRPPLNESRSFLLSWLSGYFAADGTVSKTGVAQLESASKSSLEFVRGVAAICGVGCGFVRHRMRVGFGDKASALYRVTLRVADLPDWFFRIAEHARRSKLPSKERDLPWVVESITATNTVEEVFCAVVPGVQAFGLSGDLMTGNCPSLKPAELTELVEKHPDLADRIIAIEAAAKPKLTAIEGLWRNGCKGTRGAEARPGSMTVFIEALRARRALPVLQAVPRACDGDEA